MKRRHKFTGILIIIIFFSFTQKEKSLNSNLVGHWVYKNYNEDKKEMTFKKRLKFKKKEFGYRFKKNGKLIKRQSVGWCGTPPIKLGNYDGEWKIVNDSIIKMKYHYWGGIKEESWKIILSNKNELKVKL